MASVNLESIARALVATIKSRHAGREFSCYWYDEPQAAVNGPTLTVLPGDPLYVPFGTMGPAGRADVKFVIRVRMNGSSLEGVFTRLYSFASHGTGNPDSIHDAVMADRTLGNVVSDCVLGDVTYGEDDGGRYLEIEAFIIAMKQGAQV